MQSSFEEIAGYLSCPDDQGSLDEDTESLKCSRCGRVYPFTRGEIVELLPREPAAPVANREYALEYDRLFHRAFETGEASRAWGARESSSPADIRKRERQGRAVLSVLKATGRPLGELGLCDLSAGPGDYTLFFARHFKWVLHCDLSVDALHYALSRSRQMGLTNVFFLRVDYFALPFNRSLDRLLCLDTLIRGPDHEKALLGQIQCALGPQGRAIIDFHHWWHNPLRRLGLLPENFGQNRSYTRHQAEQLLGESGIEAWKLIRFHQEFEASNPLRLLSLPPATRLMYEFGGTVERSAAEAVKS
jgi:SAM-dependent methyltransferase